MTPQDIVLLGERLTRYLTAEELKHVSIVVNTDDWHAMCAWMSQWEPITQWPKPERESVHHLKVRDIPIIQG